FTSKPSAAKKPKSCATTSGRVPLKVGVLEAKLTVLAWTRAIAPTAMSVRKVNNAIRIVLIISLERVERFIASGRVLWPPGGREKPFRRLPFFSFPPRLYRWQPDRPYLLV